MKKLRTLLTIVILCISLVIPSIAYSVSPTMPGFDHTTLQNYEPFPVLTYEEEDALIKSHRGMTIEEKIAFEAEKAPDGFIPLLLFMAHNADVWEFILRWVDDVKISYVELSMAGLQVKASAAADIIKDEAVASARYYYSFLDLTFDYTSLENFERLRPIFVPEDNDPSYEKMTDAEKIEYALARTPDGESLLLRFDFVLDADVWEFIEKYNSHITVSYVAEQCVTKAMMRHEGIPVEMYIDRSFIPITHAVAFLNVEKEIVRDIISDEAVAKAACTYPEISEDDLSFKVVGLRSTLNYKFDPADYGAVPLPKLSEEELDEIRKAHEGMTDRQIVEYEISLRDDDEYVPMEVHMGDFYSFDSTVIKFLDRHRDVVQVCDEGFYSIDLLIKKSAIWDVLHDKAVTYYRYPYPSNDIIFEPDPILDPIPIGDINGDYVINIIDAIVLVEYFAGRDRELYYDNGDVNDDGYVNTLDAIVIAQVIVGG